MDERAATNARARRRACELNVLNVERQRSSRAPAEGVAVRRIVRRVVLVVPREAGRHEAEAVGDDEFAIRLGGLLKRHPPLLLALPVGKRVDDGHGGLPPIVDRPEVELVPSRAVVVRVFLSLDKMEATDGRHSGCGSKRRPRPLLSVGGMGTECLDRLGDRRHCAQDARRGIRKAGPRGIRHRRF